MAIGDRNWEGYEVTVPGCIIKNYLQKIACAFNQNLKGGFLGGDYIQIDYNGLIIRVKKHTRYAAWCRRRTYRLIRIPMRFQSEEVVLRENILG